MKVTLFMKVKYTFIFVEFRKVVYIFNSVDKLGWQLRLHDEKLMFRLCVVNNLNVNQINEIN